MKCAQCGAAATGHRVPVPPRPVDETLTPSFRPILMCARCWAIFAAADKDDLDDALGGFVVQKLGAYPSVRPDPKIVDALVMAMVSRVGQIIGTLHAGTPEIAHAGGGQHAHV